MKLIPLQSLRFLVAAVYDRRDSLAISTFSGGHRPPLQGAGGGCKLAARLSGGSLGLGSVALAAAVMALGAGPMASFAKAIPGEAYTEVTGDGGWCWFSGPRALRQDGRTFTGWVTTDGSIQIGEVGVGAAPARIVTLHDQLQRDDHCNPAFLSLPDGRLAAFYTTHGTDDLFLRTTEKPGDISAWTPTRRLGMLPGGKVSGYGVTYANPVRLTDETNRLYVFFRGVNWKPTVTISDDLGKTWTKPETYISRQSRTNANRPYARYWDDGKGRIDFLFTDGHPRNEVTNRVHFMRYEKGFFTKADGTRIGTLADLPIDPDKADVVYDGRSGRGWIWDIAEDQSGHPVIAYTRLPGDTKADMGRDHQYWYARWDGKQWVDHEIAAGGKWFPHTAEGKVETEPHYSAGLSLDAADPATVYYAAPVKGVFEIFHARTTDGGATWKATALTENSRNDNVRPIVVRNHGGDSPTVLWMNLRKYVHFTDYEVSIRSDRPGAVAK